MDIVGIGKPCIDIVSVVDRLPGPNSGTRINDFSRQGGGNVATAMVAAARLGLKTGMVGMVGTCTHGKAICDDFMYNGVDISHIIKIDGAYSDFAIILSDLATQGRSILYRKGNLRNPQVSDLNKSYITNADILHLEGYGEVEKTAAKWMREAGKKVAYDGAGYSDSLRAFLPNIDYFIASEFYYKTVFGNDTDYEKNCKNVEGPEVVVFTLGSKGYVGFSKKEGFFAENGLAVNVIDTLGAGDVFHGAFLFGLSKGWTAQQTARFANTVSAIKIGYIGGRAGIPSYETAKQYMDTGILEDTELKQRAEYYQNKWLFG
jgi:sulfofructose kinase